MVQPRRIYMGPKDVLTLLENLTCNIGSHNFVTFSWQCLSPCKVYCRWSCRFALLQRQYSYSDTRNSPVLNRTVINVLHTMNTNIKECEHPKNYYRMKGHVAVCMTSVGNIMAWRRQMRAPVATPPPCALAGIAATFTTVSRCLSSSVSREWPASSPVCG
jgi:hypothetical protein